MIDQNKLLTSPTYIKSLILENRPIQEKNITTKIKDGIVFVCISDFYRQLTGSSFSQTLNNYQSSLILNQNPDLLFRENKKYWVNIDDFHSCCLLFFDRIFIQFCYNRLDYYPGYIYLLYEPLEENKYKIKIGRTVNIKMRMQSYYTRDHPDMNIKKLYVAYNIKIAEKFSKMACLHYISSKITNEYFICNKTQLDTIMNILDSFLTCVGDDVDDYEKINIDEILSDTNIKDELKSQNEIMKDDILNGNV